LPPFSIGWNNNVQENFMKTRLLAAMLIALALGLAIGCEQPAGPENQQGAELPAAEESPGVTYVGATDEGTPVELFIEGDTYTVKVGEEVSRGTAAKAADGTWTLQPEGDGKAFTAKADEDGLTIEGPITDDIDGEDLHELYPVEKEPPSDVEADYRISLSVAAIHVFPAVNAGYTAQSAKTIAVTNSGSKATGELTLTVSNGHFTLNKETIPSIAAGKKAAFTVKPALGLEAGVYNARVTVSDDNDITAGFNVRFTVNKADGSPPDTEEPEEPEDPDAPKPDYRINLSQSETLVFEEEVAGYKALTPATITISNTGNKATGKLTIAVSNTDFTLDKKTISSITKTDGTATFTVVPKTGLKAGVYAATVTVSGSNIEEQSFEVSFEVGAAVFGIELSETDTLVFDDAIFGYKPLVARAVTISNIGNQPTGALTLKVSNENFRVNNGTIASIAVADTAKFTVVPGGGLLVGPYSATVTVTGGNGISAAFDVSFEVRPVPEYGIELNISGTHIFPAAILGYAAQAAKLVTISNIGNQSTGALTIGVSNGDFTLNKTAIDSLAVKGEAEFTVVPNTGLSAGVYTATVSVTGSNDISASFGVTFTVTATYGISLDAGETYTFPSAILGYTAQAVKAITISNTGDQPTGGLTIGVTGADFTLDKQTITSLAVKGEAEFTVVPKTGLAAGPHTATVTVSGSNDISASFEVSFTVTATYGISLDADEAYAFPEAIFGYTAQAEKAVIISNNGDQPTGALTVSAGADFEVTTPANGAVNSIPVGETATFSVRPKLDLSEGTHSATVSVTGDNGISATFGVSFYVIAATYSVSLEVSGGNSFPEAILGYGAQAAKTVNISNTGNQPTGNLTLDMSNSSAFTLDPPTTVASIAVGSSGSFTVVPKTGLAVGPHTALITVSSTTGINTGFEVSFVVTATYGIELSETEPYAFPEAIFDYGAQAAKMVNISNTGDQPTGNLTVALTGDNPSAFTASPSAVTSIAVNGNGFFTVVPKTGLQPGTYSATVTVSGDANIEPRSFGVSFEVKVAFASIVMRMAEDKNSPSASYTLSGGEETYTAVELSSANCPANVVIDGNGGVITGNGHIDGVVVGTGVRLTIKNITFKNLKFTVRDGGTLVLEDGAVLRENGGSGVTVGDNGFLEMKDGALVEANGYSGVLMYGTGGRFTMDGGTISGNSNRGGVRMDGQESVFTMNGGLISNNSGSWGGGVMVLGGNSVFTMTDGEISGNEAMAGGAVMLWQYANTTFKMEGGVIKNNHAIDSGGGVNVLITGTFNMTGGEITDNTAANKDGGVSFFQYTTFSGNPQIGGTAAPNGKGWIHANMPNETNWGAD
jgi:uncharacterized membrane protein